MTHKHRQVKNGLFYLFSTAIDNVIPMILLPVLTRILLPQDYGLMALAQVYAVFVSGIANFGLSISYDRSYFQYDKDRFKSAQLFFSIVSFVVLNCLALGIVTYFCRGAISTWMLHAKGMEELLMVVLVGECISSLQQYYLTYFKNREKAKSSVGFSIAGSIVTFVLSLWFVVVLRTGVLGLAYARLISAAAVLIAVNVRFFRKLPFAFDARMLKDALKISFPLTPRIFFGVLSSQFDKFMLGLLSTTSGVGIYTIGQSISGFIFVYITSLQNVYQPQIYKRFFDLPAEEAARSVGRYLTPFTYICIFSGVALALFCEELLALLTTKPYQGAVDIIMIMSMYYGFLFFGKISAIQLLFKKKTAILSVLSIVTIIVNVLVNIPFIHLWGAKGAAWATFSVGIVSVIVSFWWAQRHCRIDWEYRLIAGIFAIFFAAALTAMTVRDLGLAYPLRLCLKVVWLAIYLFWGTQCRVFTRENWEMMRGFAKFGPSTA